MIVKILQASRTFKGVRYNTNKVDKNKGELMKVSGFGPLQGLTTLMPQDYINYLKMVSTGNKRTVYPQFHVTISAKGKSTGKEALTEIASNWMKEMGYGDQPYLVIFHKDTANNHVHIVSTRINKEGKKIDSGFEKMRAVHNMNKIMKLDALETARLDLQKALSYHFSTKAQFMMILEGKGYVLKEKGERLELIKFGKKLVGVELQQVEDRIGSSVIDSKRTLQIAAIIHKYKTGYSAELRDMGVPLPGGFEKTGGQLTSDLCEVLKEKLGLQFLFHGQARMAPYGYTVIDHAGGIVYKGKQVMDLKDLLLPVDLASSQYVVSEKIEDIEVPEINLYEEFPIERCIDGEEGLDTPVQNGLSLSSGYGQDTVFEPLEAPVNISISDDIDDEAIHGRNRHRKRQARTNTR